MIYFNKNDLLSGFRFWDERVNLQSLHMITPLLKSDNMITPEDFEYKDKQWLRLRIVVTVGKIKLFVNDELVLLTPYTHYLHSLLIFTP